MAKYDREFLVPYLQDICTLYLAERKLREKIKWLTDRINHLSYEIVVTPPKEPSYEKSGCFEGFAWILGLFMAGGSVLGLMSGEDLSGFEMIPVMGIIIGGVILAFAIGANSEQRKTNDELRKNYEAALKAYERDVDNAKRQNVLNKEKIPELLARKEMFSNELKKVSKLLKQAYSVNVIPRHYRDVYAAVYLYDFFSTGRSDDLDMALSLFVLEQIKDKLDKIIQQQADILLNQRIMISTQKQALEEQRAHNAYLEKKIHKIATSAEESNQYLAMIESNTAANAYFSAALYLKK